MTSWVRYSVAVYVGLLLSGSLVLSPETTVGSAGPRDSAEPLTPLPCCHTRADAAHNDRLLDTKPYPQRRYDRR